MLSLNCCKVLSEGSNMMQSYEHEKIYEQSGVPKNVVKHFNAQTNFSLTNETLFFVLSKISNNPLIPIGIVSSEFGCDLTTLR